MSVDLKAFICYIKLVVHLESASHLISILGALILADERGAKHSPHQRKQEMALGTWHLALGISHLALGTWHLALGTWNMTRGNRWRV